jgi:hypothetical protein
VVAAVLALGLLLGVGYLAFSAWKPASADTDGTVPAEGPPARVVTDLSKGPLRAYADPAHGLEGVVDFRDIAGVDWQRFRDWQAGLGPDFRLSLLTSRRGPGAPLFNAIAVRELAPRRIEFVPGLTAETHQEDWDRHTNEKQGARLLAICLSHRPDGKPGLSTSRLWLMDGAGFYSWNGPLANLKGLVESSRAKGFRTVHLEYRPSHEAQPCHSIEAGPCTGKAWDFAWDAVYSLSPEELFQAVELYRLKGWRPDVLAPCWDDGRLWFMLVAVDNKDGPDWRFRMDMTLHQYEEESSERRGLGWFPLVLCSYGGDDKARYAAVWARGRVQASGANR